MPKSDSNYLAFISYSRSDNDHDGRRWADWIKEMIEKFPIPINCLPADLDSGTHLGGTREVFLDRSRLTAGGGLSDQLESHLRRAEYLVVICSPRSAGSEYVGFEIDFFKNAGRVDRIIPVVVDGANADDGSGKCWIPDSLRELIQMRMPVESVRDRKDTSLIYSDFRVREKLPNNTVFDEEGWTDPSHFEKHLRSKNTYSDSEVAKRLAAYRQVHSVAKFALLGAVFGLEPVQLEGQSLLEENERKRRVIRENRRKLTLLGLFSLAMACMAAVTYGFYRKAETERANSERSLQMIGDAHERTTRLIADLINDFRSRPDPVDKASALGSARMIIDEHFDEIDPGGSDHESRHMRAVVLDSRGHLARKTGELRSASDYYLKSLAIREELIAANGPKAIHLHNLSISHDNLGDVYVALANIVTSNEKERADLYDKAIGEYQKGLAKAKELSARPDATLQWHHDVAVSYLKVSAGLLEAGDVGDALQVLKEGRPAAEKAAAGDLSYAKWQAHLGAYHLALAELHDANDEPDAARVSFIRAKEIFDTLASKHPLSRQQTTWKDRVEAGLKGLASPAGKEPK